MIGQRTAALLKEVWINETAGRVHEKAVMRDWLGRTTEPNWFPCVGKAPLFSDLLRQLVRRAPSLAKVSRGVRRFDPARTAQ